MLQNKIGINGFSFSVGTCLRECGFRTLVRDTFPSIRSTWQNTSKQKL